jgi:hypothetical protein
MYRRRNIAPAAPWSVQFSKPENRERVADTDFPGTPALRDALAELSTEGANERYADLDLLSTRDLVAAMNDEDARVAPAGSACSTRARRRRHSASTWTASSASSRVGRPRWSPRSKERRTTRRPVATTSPTLTSARSIPSSAFPPTAGRPTSSQLSPKPAARTQPASAEALLAEHDGFLRPALAADPAADDELPAVPVE